MSNGGNMPGLPSVMGILTPATTNSVPGEKRYSEPQNEGSVSFASQKKINY